MLFRSRLTERLTCAWRIDGIYTSTSTTRSLGCVSTFVKGVGAGISSYVIEPTVIGENENAVEELENIENGNLVSEENTNENEE